MKTELTINGMSCNHCVTAVKSALAGVAGVTSAEVSLADKRAVVEHDPTTDLAALIASVEEEGYEARRNDTD